MVDGEPVRINKYLADCGVCSRRQADEMVAQGRVTVDGETAVTGTKVVPSQDVRVDGKNIKDDGKTIVLLLNKPVGIVCTTAEDEKDNVVKFVNYKRRVYPVGRLDKDSRGLLILTNRGDLGLPMVFDVDIGHKAPRMTMINGARVVVEVKGDSGRISYPGLTEGY